jgi:hypothetical protein
MGHAALTFARNSLEVEDLQAASVGASLMGGDLLQLVDDVVHAAQGVTDLLQVADGRRVKVQARTRIVEQQFQVAPGDGQRLFQFVGDSASELDDDPVPLQLEQLMRYLLKRCQGDNP